MDSGSSLERLPRSESVWGLRRMLAEPPPSVLARDRGTEPPQGLFPPFPGPYRLTTWISLTARSMLLARSIVVDPEIAPVQLMSYRAVAVTVFAPWVL